jgi:hypothetical protein
VAWALIPMFPGSSLCQIQEIKEDVENIAFVQSIGEDLELTIMKYSSDHVIVSSIHPCHVPSIRRVNTPLMWRLHPHSQYVRALN